MCAKSSHRLPQLWRSFLLWFIFWDGHAHSVIVIITECWLGMPSLNSSLGHCVPFYSNTLGKGINLFLLPAMVGNQSGKRITLNSKLVEHWVGSSTSYLLWKLQLSETMALYSTGQSVWVTISVHTEVIYVKIKLFHHLLKVYIVSKQNKNYLNFIIVKQKHHLLWWICGSIHKMKWDGLLLFFTFWW